MGPHDNQPVTYAGAPLAGAKSALIMIHGRGADANDILGLAPLVAPPNMACLAPTAAGNTWYPFSFMAPRAQNEPYLASALGLIERLVSDLIARGIPAEKIALLGFSQGACLSSEFIVRHPRRYGGLIAFSGGLIGPAGTTWTDVATRLDGLPAFFGCSDVDPHIPKARVLETESVFRALGGEVKAKLYPGMPHTVNEDELAEARAIIARL
jgi:predicted esterase